MRRANPCPSVTDRASTAKEWLAESIAAFLVATRFKVGRVVLVYWRWQLAGQK
jgi:hypothetical protein